MKDLVLDFFKGALVLRSRQDKLVLLLFQIWPLILDHNAEQLVFSVNLQSGWGRVTHADFGVIFRVI